MANRQLYQLDPRTLNPTDVFASQDNAGAAEAGKNTIQNIIDLVPTPTLVAGPGITVNDLEITASVRSVNGLFPTNGNIQTSLTATKTGLSSSLILSASGNVTASLADGLVWIVAGETGPTSGSNGLVYIYASASVGAWYPVASVDQAANDARYLMLTPQSPLAGTLNLGGQNLTNGGTITATSFAGTASWANRALTASAAGLSGQIQYNANGLPTATADLIYDGQQITVNTLRVGNPQIVDGQDLGVGTTSDQVIAILGIDGQYNYANKQYRYKDNHEFTGSVVSTGGFTGSLQGTASYATTAGNGGVTRIIAGTNINLSPLNGLGEVTVNSALAEAFPYTGSATISGSLVVTGPISATGGFTGSLLGTASYASNVILVATGSSLYTTNTSNVQPDESIYIGSGTGQGTATNYTVMVGNEAGSSFGNNAGAVLVGYRAGKGATGTSVNGIVAIGANAALNATGIIGGAVYIGQGAGYLAAGGYSTVNIGMSAGQQASNAYKSVFVGQEAGVLQASATYNIMLGYQAGKVASAGLAAGSNNITIGNNVALPAGRTNSLNIGGTIFATGIYSTMDVMFSGSVQTAKVGIATLNPAYTLDVSGSGNFTNSLTVTGSISMLSGSLSGSVVTNLTDIYTSTAAVTRIVTLTSAEYSGIGSPDANTLYVVI